MPHKPVPVAPADALNRPLSPFEIVFWRLAEAGSLNVTTIASVHGPLSEEALEAGLKHVRLRHPLLRVRICTSAGPAGFVTSDVPAIPLRHVARNADDWAPIVEEEINDSIDVQRGPLARCTWIRHTETTHHLLITFHHAIGDGMSGVLLMRDLLQAAAAQLARTAEGVVQQLAPPLDDSLPMDLRLPRDARGWKGVGKQLRFMAGVACEDIRLRPPARPRADQPAPLAARSTRLLSRSFESDFVDRLAQTARDQNTTVHGALSAAICLATAKDNSDTDPLSMKHRSPVNMRPLLEPPVGDDVGMFASMAFYRGRVKAEDDFWDLARGIRANIKNQIDRGVPAVLIGMLPRLYRMIRGDRFSADEFATRWQQHTPSTTGLTNLGRIDLAGEFGPLEIRSVHFAVSPGGLGDCSCTATTYRGGMRWNFLFAAPLFADDRADRITNDAVERLTDAIAD